MRRFSHPHFELLDDPDMAPIARLVPARMLAQSQMEMKDHDNLAPTIERVLRELQAATREVEEETERIRHGIGMTPRQKRS